jgi:hypothetical protein
MFKPRTKKKDEIYINETILIRQKREQIVCLIFFFFPIIDYSILFIPIRTIKSYENKTLLKKKREKKGKNERFKRKMPFIPKRTIKKIDFEKKEKKDKPTLETRNNFKLVEEEYKTDQLIPSFLKAIIIIWINWDRRTNI